MNKLFLFTTIVFVAVFAGFATINVGSSFSVGVFSNYLENEVVLEEISKPKSISFVGDVLLARRVESYLDAYGSNYVYSAMLPVSTTTVLIGNFESAIPEVHSHTPDNTFSFSVDATHVPALYEFGFRFMSLANNHSTDKGIVAFENTQNVLTENGVLPIGSPLGLSTTSISFIDLEGKKVAIIGLYALDVSPKKADIQEVFEYATGLSDVQIVYVHWGVEYTPRHSVSQQKLAYTLIDAGADAVIGHHPHVVQDIELYKNVPIFYSLGNFIFDQYFSTEVQQGLWVDLEFEEDALVYKLQGVTSIGSRSVPRFMAAYENDLFMSALAKKSSKSLSSQIREGKIKQ